MVSQAVVSRVQDGALAVVLAGVALVEIWTPLPSVMGEGSPVLTSVVAVVTCAAVAARRVWPFATAAVVLLTWPVVFLVTPVLVLFWGQFVPMVVALYSVARHGTGRRDLYGAGLGVLTLLTFDVFVSVLQVPAEIVFHWLVFTLAWSAGHGLRVMERRARESATRAVEAETASRQKVQSAIADERARIARELHDVIAHAVTVMVVQAGAAEQLVDDDPERVRSALSAIRTTGTGALAEMRRVVAMLREDGQAEDLRPQPGLAAVPALVDEARRGGLHVELVVEGRPRELPAGLDLSAYRIVQEALTNVRRHSGASTVRVALRYEPESLQVEVRDDGRGAPEDLLAGRGHGLVGMRERAALYGGHLETSSLDGKGFAVRAALPLAAAPV